MATEEEMITLLVEAIEGELDGLAIEPETARAILAHINPAPARNVVALEDMILPLDGYDRNQPGFQYRKGWNDAIMRLMDYHAAITPAPAVNVEAVVTKELLAEARSHVVGLQQCSIFAQDAGQYIALQMRQSADFIEKLVAMMQAPPPSTDNPVEKNEPVAFRFKHEHLPASWKYADKNPNCRPWNSFEPLYSASTVEALKAENAALLSQVERLTKAIKPFASAGAVIDGPFGPALFAEDHMAFQSGCAWTENGERKTITWGDFRNARTALQEKSHGHPSEV